LTVHFAELDALLSLSFVQERFTDHGTLVRLTSDAHWLYLGGDLAVITVRNRIGCRRHEFSVPILRDLCIVRRLLNRVHAGTIFTLKMIAVPVVDCDCFGIVTVQSWVFLAYVCSERLVVKVIFMACHLDNVALALACSAVTFSPRRLLPGELVNWLRSI